MLPSLSTTTLPWHGPIVGLAVGARPQPGTVSNVITPLPILTGAVSSAEKAQGASPNKRDGHSNRTVLHDQDSHHKVWLSASRAGENAIGL